MTAILFLIGQKLESPEIITQLLNPELHPCKPAYEMASELPLLLYDCGYEDSALKWKDADCETIAMLESHMHEQWRISATKTTLLSTVMEQIDKIRVNGSHLPNAMSVAEAKKLNKLDMRHKRHVPLLNRPKSTTVEEKVANDRKRRRMENNDASSTGNSEATKANDDDE